jgi:catechol 2,3-dioxygenase-like lactoylglutathione lyase family enzyme
VGEVQRLHHTGYTVSDLDRSLEFYCDLLGCEVVARQEKQGGYLAAIVGYPDAHVRMAHIRAPGSEHIIELFQYLAPVPGRAQLEPRNVGTAHMCFIVEDLSATHQRLLASGVHFFSPPVEIDTGINTGASGLYLHDPDGIPVELFEPPPRPRGAGTTQAASVSPR